MSTRRSQKPWSMKWIVVAILLFVAGYTAINLYYRKPGRAYRPYQDAQDRATTARLLAAGWHKIQLEARRPTEPARLSAPIAKIRHELAGLGPDLESKFAEKPKLVTSIDHVTAPAEVAAGADYALYFTVNTANLKSQVGDLALYRRDHELVLVPSLETLPGAELKSRWTDTNHSISFPTTALEPGRYTMRIVAMAPAATWTFDVK